MGYHRKYHPFNCFYCGVSLVSLVSQPGHPHQITIDHVVPLSKGGADELVNMISACWECNQAKGAKSLEEFICLARPLWAGAMHRQWRKRQEKLTPINRHGVEWLQRQRKAAR